MNSNDIATPAGAHTDHDHHDASDAAMPQQHTGQHHHDGHGHGGHDKHAGHDPEMFRRRFWLTLLLTVPLVVTSEMVMDWFGYALDFPGMAWVGPRARHVRLLLGRLAVPRRRRRRGPRPRSRG